MGREKDFDNSWLNTDKENVKPDLQEIFKNPRLIWELYRNLSLSDTDSLILLERLSHHLTIKKLYEGIPNIDKFASSQKTLKSCFKWDIDEMWAFYMALLPQIFSSFKELYMGKTSRQDSLNKLNDEDLQELKDISVTPNNLSNKQIISEIRNALNHTHYVPGKDELYIKNPKNSNSRIHARDFEANVPYTFFLDFIRVTQTYYRKSDWYDFLVEDEELLNDIFNNKNIKYEDVSDKIQFFQIVTKDKFWNENYDNSEKGEVKKELIRSEQLENLLLKYFSNHNLDFKNLRYISESLIKPPEIHMWEILETIIRREMFLGNRCKWLNYGELVDDVYKNMILWWYYWYLDYTDQSDWPICKEVEEIIVELWERLGKQRQSNWQSLLKYLNWCIKYIRKYLDNNWFIYYKEWEVEYIKKWNVKVNLIYIQALIDGLYSLYYLIDSMIKLFPNRLRLQLIKLAYVTQQVSLSDENLNWLISKVDISEKAKNKITTRERIRNSLSHHTYIILEGVDDIILRDWYKKKTDSWDREATFNLSKLFESTFKEINEKDIDVSRSSLQELLDSLDNSKR